MGSRRSIRSPSKPSRAESQGLHNVVGSLAQRYGVVDGQCAERRGPGQAGADRRAYDILVGDLKRCGGSAVAEYAAGIDKGRGPETVLVGYTGDCALQLGGRRPIRA